MAKQLNGQSGILSGFMLKVEYMTFNYRGTVIKASIMELQE